MTPAGQSPSIFESFNARALEPHQVAKTFVPSLHYRTLAKRAHTIIVGPRGSGKTTLLKMLQQPALESWEHSDAQTFRNTIDFTGVFVATDVSWGAQLGALGHGKLDEDSHRVFSIAAFTTHVLRALILAMQWRIYGTNSPKLVAPHRRVTLSTDAEISLVRHMSKSLFLAPPLPSLLSLKQALTSRMAEIHVIANRETMLGITGRKERLAQIQFLHLHFLTVMTVCAEVFDDAAKSGPDRWALLFDELELAPQWIREELFRSLRSAESRFIFKLSMSPYNVDADDLDRALVASPGNDYDEIALWYAHKEDGSPFCHVLWEAMLKDRGIAPMSPEDILGRSEFETLADEWVESGTAYSPGSRLQKRIARVASVDASFAQYLKEKDIDINSLHKLEGDTRAADIRKAAPLLVVREAFKSISRSTTHESRQTTRSRKNPKLYAGASSLFAIVEGNPRWFIGIIGRLLDGMSPKSCHVPAARQAREEQATCDRFAAMLRTIPCPITIGNKGGETVLGILDRVGQYFFEQVVVHDFTPDPAGSFTVDDDLADDLVICLGRALNAGALVFVPDDTGAILVKSFRGKRFRLSYLLAPRYQIPIRLGRHVLLSFILNQTERRSSPPSLFDNKENV